MPRTRRQYDQFCPLATGLDVVGERWALLVVRELLLGAKRFVDLEAGLPGIGTNTLTIRLDGLEAAGVIVRRRLPAPAAVTVYELTPWGRSLEPILYSFARWAAPMLAKSRARHGLRATWLGVALSAYYRREAAPDLTAVVELAMPSGTLALDFRRGRLRVSEGTAENPALRITGSENDILALLGVPAPRAGRGKPRLSVDGDATLLDRLVAAFPLADALAA